MISLQLHKPDEYNLDIQFPQSWNELSLEELVLVANSYFTESGISLPELFIAFLQERVKAKYPKVDADRLVVLLNIEDLAIEYQELMAFISESNTLTTNPISIPGQKVPEDHFDSTLVGEFEIADQALNRFLQSGKSKDLTEFFEGFFATKIHVPDSYKKVAALFFLGCKNELMQIFPSVFGSGESEASQPDPMALTRVIHESAGPANGTRADIRKTLLKEFLYDLQLKAERE